MFADFSSLALTSVTPKESRLNASMDAFTASVQVFALLNTLNCPPSRIFLIHGIAKSNLLQVFIRTEIVHQFDYGIVNTDGFQKSVFVDPAVLNLSRTH